MKSRFLLFLVVLILAVVVWRIVDLGLSRQQPPSDIPVVLTTIFPLYDIVRTIAGDKLDVVQLIPNGAEPHSFEPTPSTVETIMNADVLYAIGYGYDDWTKDLAPARTDVISLSADIALRRTLLENGITITDPHYWLSIPNAQRIAELAAKDLSSRFPEHKATFAGNLAAYTTQLTELENEIQTTLAAMENKNIVTMHDAWYYFANAYGLTVLGTFEENEEGEPTARHLEELAAAMDAANVSTIFVDFGVHEDALTQFAEDHNYSLVTVDPEGSGTYTSFLDLMHFNAQAFAKND